MSSLVCLSLCLFDVLFVACQKQRSTKQLTEVFKMLLSEIFDDSLASTTLLGGVGKNSNFSNIFGDYTYVGFYFHHETNDNLSNRCGLDQNKSQLQPCQLFLEQMKVLTENLRNPSSINSTSTNKTKLGPGNGLYFAITFVTIPQCIDGKESRGSDCCITRELRDDFIWVLPANEQQAMVLLSRIYKVRTTPAFVIVDAKTKRTIAVDGRRALQADQLGRRFPWHLPEATDVFQGQLLSKRKSNGTNDGEMVETDELNGSIKCLLFAAHWCPPCRSFVRQLTQTYLQLKSSSSSIQFEIIYCSMDRCKESFRQFYADMPWLAFPYNDPRCIAATRLYNVQEIPTFLILDADNRLITKHGKCELNMDPNGKEFPWYPKVILELNPFTASRLREDMSFLLFTEGTPEDLAFAHTSLLPVADEFCMKTSSDQQDLLFFYCGDDAICDQLWENLELCDASLPLICILDPFTDSLYVCDDPNVSEVIIRRFIGKFYSGELEPTKRFTLPLMTSARGNYVLNSPQQPNVNFADSNQSDGQVNVVGNKRLCTNVGGTESTSTRYSL